MINFIPKYWALQKSSIFPLSVWDIRLQKHMLQKVEVGQKPQLWMRSGAAPRGVRFHPLHRLPAVSLRVATVSKTNKGQFLPSLLSFAPSHMWASEKEAKHSSCKVAMFAEHRCEALSLRRYHWCTAKEPHIWFSRAWVKAFWLVTGERETARHHLTVCVLSNTFCSLTELAWKLDQHLFSKRMVHSEWG